MLNRWHLYTILFLWLAWPGFSQDPGDPFTLEDSIEIDIDIFAPETPARITLEYDMKEFRKRKGTDKYLEAKLTYHMDDSIKDRIRSVRIRPRGKNRREVCTFPPIWINIRKSGIDNRFLENIKKIKLVTHCGGSRAYESYVLREFIAYRIYNLISPYSFRTRLVRMKYIDTGRSNRELESWAFLIEPEEMLAERMDMLPFKNDRVSMKGTDSTWMDRMALFQYMIGNSDYSVTGRHNVKILRDKYPAKLKLIPVPYDFDYSGLVNARYAIPGDNLGIESVRERYFLGPCRDASEYRKTIDKFLSLQEGINNLVNDFEYLPRYEKADILKYLDGFFNNITESRYVEQRVMSTCR
jgi:hypothetical protein